MSIDQNTQSVQASSRSLTVRIGLLVVFGLAYLLSTRLGLLFISQAEGIAVVWPASGVLLAALQLSKRRIWPVILLLAFLINVSLNLAADYPVSVALGFAVVECIEGAFAAWLLSRFLHAPLNMSHLLDVVGLIGIGAILCNGLTATLGALVINLSFGTPFLDSWFTWWMSAGIGTLLVAPLILAWATLDKATLKRLPPLYVIESVILFVALAWVAAFIFTRTPEIGSFAVPLPYATFPFLLWAALRFGPRGATGASLVLSTIAIWTTFHDQGPFAMISLSASQEILAVQAFLVVSAMTALALAAVIAERKYAEEALRENEERLRMITSNMADVVARLDAEMRYVYVSPSVTRLYGYKPEELLGKSSVELIHPADVEILLSTARDARTAHVPAVSIEHRYRQANGEYRWLESNIQLLYDDQWNSTGSVITSRDISARKRAENGLRESEEKYRSIVENSLAGIFTVDDAYHFTYANDEVCRILAYPRDELIGLDFRIPLSEESRAMVVDRYIRRQRGETVPPHYELKVVRPSGEVRDAEMIVSVMKDATGRPITMGQLIDITERKRVEEGIMASERRLSEALRVAKMGCWDYDVPSGLFTFNDQYYALHRTTSAAAGGDKMTAEHFARNFVFPDDAHQVQDAIDKAITSTDPDFQLQLESRILCADGETRWIIVWFRIEKDEAGRTIKLHGVNQDIHERKQAEEKVHHHASRVEALARTATQINRQLDLNTTLTSVCKEAARALHVQASLIVLTDPVYQTINAITGYGLPSDFRNDFPSVPLSIFNESLAEHPDTPIIIQDQAVFSGITKEDLFAKYDVHTMVVAPIKGQVQIIGALVVLSIGKPHQYDVDELSLLQALADEAAQAIINTHLLEDARRRLDRLEALRTIDNAIAASLDLRHTLSVFLEQLRDQLNVDAADILLFNPHSLTLEYASGTGMRTDVLKHTQLHPNGDPAGQVVANRQRVLIPDIQKESYFDRRQELVLEGFVSYYGVPLITKGQVRGVLEIFNRTTEIHDNEWLDFLEALAGQAAISIDNAALFDELQRSNLELILAYEATIDGWSRAMDMRDKETEGHTQRVTQLTYQLAQAMGLEDEELAHIRRGAMLHDIGKMGVPDDILLKPGRLNQTEEIAMKKHPQYAYEMLSTIKYLKSSLDIPYCHHEKWDGTGYPRGLVGDQIPLAARLFAVVDVWDALISDRPYRPSWSKDKAIEYIREQSGKHFDPDIVRIFMATIVADQSL